MAAVRPFLLMDQTRYGYSPLNMHERSPRLFRGDYSLYIRAKLTSAVNHHGSYIGFCCIFMSVKIKNTLVGNPVTG